MTNKQFKEIFTMAKNHEYDANKTLESETFNIFNGIAIDRTKRVATKKHCAYMINWQCLYFNGEYDMQELENQQYLFTKYIDLLD